MSLRQDGGTRDGVRRAARNTNRLVQPEPNLGTDSQQGLAIAGWNFRYAGFPWDGVPRCASGSNRGVTRDCALRLARPTEIERNGVTDGERPCRVARELGADPQDWCGTFEPVPMEVWGDIQVDEGGAWITPKGPKLSHDSVSGAEVWV